MDKELQIVSTFIVFVLVTVLVITVCILVADSPTRLQSGTVIRKKHTEPQRIYNPVIFIRSGKLLIQPATYAYGSDKWQVLVQQRHKTEWWDVSEEFYQNVDIGDRITK